MIDLVIQELYKLASHCKQTDFQRQSFEILTRVIQFDSGIWTETAQNVNSLILLRSALFNQPETLLSDYEKVACYDVVAAQSLKQLGETINTSMEQLRPQLHDDFIRVFKSYNVSKAIATTSFDSNAQFMYAIALWRSEEKPDFTEDDRKIKEKLMPHLIASFKQCRQFEIQQQLLKKLRTNNALATCDELGILHDADESFISLLKQEWPQWIGAKLPEALVSQLKSITHFKGKLTQYRIMWLDGIYAIIGTELGELKNLSQREYQIAKAFSSGANYKEIALRCSISPATVRNHIANIYKKLSVQSRQELNNYWND